jgi:hypothetical protein
MRDEEDLGEAGLLRAESRNTIGFIGIVKIYPSRNQKPGNLPDQSTYSQNVSKKTKIFDTSSWL